MDICFMDISLQLAIFYGYPFGYPWISMNIHALTCYEFSIQGRLTTTIGKIYDLENFHLLQLCAVQFYCIPFLYLSYTFPIRSSQHN